jgi:hypothetical protein
MRERLDGLLAALGWLGLVTVIALGAAGIVAAMDAPPTSIPRPELTAAGDAQVTPALDAAEGQLTALSTEVDDLGTQARGALAALTGNKFDTVDAAVAAGDQLVTAILARSAAIATQLHDVPLLDTPTGVYQVSAQVRARRDRLAGALDATTGLREAWTRLTVGSVAATRMSSLLAAHDDAVLKAAAFGRQAHYNDAVKTLADAEAAIADARSLRDRLANTVDVTTIDAWLDRNAAYDTALKRLYRALRDVGGRVTNEVRDAIAAEKAAKDRLPPDTRGLVLIMSDIGRGGMSDAVIAIEDAKGRLAEALHPPDEVSPGGSPAPSPAP